MLELGNQFISVEDIKYQKPKDSRIDID
jgi:hypothetical protein